MKPSEIKDRVNEMFIEQLEEGKVPRHQTRNTIQVSGTSGKPYAGINQMILQLVKNEKEYTSNRWLTFRAIKGLGGSVNKGEKATFVTYYKSLKIKEKQDDGSIEEKIIPMLKYYNVFNIDQTTLEDVEITGSDFIRIHTAEEIIENFITCPEILQGGHPCYVPALDVVKIPSIKNFNSPEEYYATLFHELVHSTGHESRLKREGVVNFDKFGSDQYSKEELIAELGACYLSTYTGIENAIKDNSKAYLQGRLKAIKNDKNLLIGASSKAWKATEYILGQD